MVVSGPRNTHSLHHHHIVKVIYDVMLVVNVFCVSLHPKQNTRTSMYITIAHCTINYDVNLGLYYISLAAPDN